MAAKIIPMPNAGITPMAVWPIPGDAPSLRSIIQDQAITIKAQAALIDAYQANLNTAQTPPITASTPFGNGAASGTPATTLTVSGVGNGSIVVGAVIAGPGIPTGTTIASQVSGTTGGNGVYTTSVATTAASAPLTFTPPAPPWTWPSPTDAPTLTTIQQQQTAILRMQSSLMQNYQDLLNSSMTPAPPTGP